MSVNEGKPEEIYNSTSVNYVYMYDRFIFERMVNINGQTYYGYLIGSKDDTNLNTTLSSHLINIEYNFIPKLIKVQSDIIQPQIFNNTHSKDLLVFSPSKTIFNDYYYHEIESVDYIPLLNTTIDKINISLLNEKINIYN